LVGEKNSKEAEIRIIDGNRAAAEAVRLSRVQVVAAYPITPQTPVTETLSRFVERGELKAEYVAVESEHSALAVCTSASLVGARTFTATSSHGLAYMHEMLHWAAGARGLHLPTGYWLDTDLCTEQSRNIRFADSGLQDC